MELKKCKICGKQPSYKKVEPECSTHSEWVVIDCCTKIYLEPKDIQLGYNTNGMSGWEINFAELSECERETKRRWNILNS